MNILNRNIWVGAMSLMVATGELSVDAQTTKDTGGSNQAAAICSCSKRVEKGKIASRHINRAFTRQNGVRNM